MKEFPDIAETEKPCVVIVRLGKGGKYQWVAFVETEDHTRLRNDAILCLNHLLENPFIMSDEGEQE